MYLVVDDDPVFAEILTRGLIRAGQEALSASSEESALSCLRENNHIARVILDLKIGQDSGLLTLPKLLQLKPSLKIVLLTGYSSISTAVEAIKLGAVQYLCKPADVEEILSAFENHEPKSALQTAEIPQDPPSVERLEWEHIQKVLMENNGNISATARALGMHRRTLQRKLNKRPVSK